MQGGKAQACDICLPNVIRVTFLHALCAVSGKRPITIPLNSRYTEYTVYVVLTLLLGGASKRWHGWHGWLGTMSNCILARDRHTGSTVYLYLNSYTVDSHHTLVPKLRGTTA